MVDKREQILARIRTLLDTIPGVAAGPNGTIRGTGRNRDHITAAARPMIILYDGIEELVEMEGGPRRSGIQIMRLQPDITIFIGDVSEDVGTRFSALRAALLTTILQDSELIALTGNANGWGGGLNMHYLGCDFSTEAGEKREGTMTIHFAFLYPFRLIDLAA